MKIIRAIFQKKRLLLAVFQHIAAAVIMLIIASVLLESKVTISTINGEEIYRVNAFEPNKSFEDSDLFHKIFESSVEDVTRLVVIKSQMETDGYFDSSKYVDVTKYANRKGTGNNCPITAIYKLDDLIKWGKYGVQYHVKTMPMSDFLFYFDTPISIDQFGIDEFGDLYFKGYSSNEILYKKYEYESEPYTEDATNYEQISFLLSMLSDEDINELIFSYLTNTIFNQFTSYRDEEGELMVSFPIVECRYSMIDGQNQLTSCANNWVEYMKLQDNLVETIESLQTNYRQYQEKRTLYHEQDSNLRYVVRMVTEEGPQTYTNVSSLMKATDSDITEFFEEYRRYFIYYPDSLEFFGNTSLTENDVFKYVSEYDYAYPDTTHIWIGVDTEYPVQGDSFGMAHDAFQGIVPRLPFYAVCIIALAFLWCGIGIYQIINTGKWYDEKEEKQLKLYKIDYIWTEAMLTFFSLFLLGCQWGILQLNAIVNESNLEGIERTDWYRYGCFAMFGFLSSWVFCIFFYSLVRRIQGRNLWKKSLFCMIFRGVFRVFDFILTHGNAAVRTLIMYNLFLLLNVLGVYLLYTYRTVFGIVFTIIISMVVFDVFIGMILFKNSAERSDIVDGINRIRGGEVEYKLNVDTLRGTNREMADAVNNIGEGIRKAVSTSMKDEKMRTDLITNVSHDIKTPLTSIINYVDLIKRMGIQEEPLKGYIAILDTKSQRLKQLTDDLVEASKISSGNIKLDKKDIDLTELVSQTIGEFSDKLEEKRLTVIFENSTLATHIYADSRRMWRVIENLFNNLCKYALEGTRVYIDMKVNEGVVELSIKNISKEQMNIKPEELTERFIRGDSARSTEGSGLGLSIARSLVEVQGGNFEIQLDGDLFKIVIRFPEYNPQPFELIDMTGQEK
ncbi:MAG: HAMP domain-containing histidine kinase [Acetatifactor sp.]|nr:HAMP domain-containing histidine kinase [Acetatifactor sp.]